MSIVLKNGLQVDENTVDLVPARALTTYCVIREVTYKLGRHSLTRTDRLYTTRPALGDRVISMNTQPSNKEKS